MPSNLYHHTYVRNGVAVLAGFLLMFGTTSISPFEILAVIVAILTIYVVVVSRIFFVHTSVQNYFLLGFLAIVFGQLAYIEESNILFTLITIYLIGVYILIQFWYKKYPVILKYAAQGYIIAALVSSTLGLIGYLGRVFNLENVTEIFFWDSIRISVFFDDPNVYAAFLIPALILLSYKTCFSSIVKEYLFYASGTLLIFATMILSGSRGAWLNFIIVGFVFFILYKPMHERTVFIKALLLSTCAFILAVSLIFVIPVGGGTYYTATLASRYQSSDQPRIQNILSAPQFIMERHIAEIILGSGSGSYEQITEEKFSAHNVYLRILYEQGIAGILLFVLFLAFLLNKLVYARSVQPLYASLLFAILLGMLVHGLFIDTLHWRHFWFVIAFI